MNEQEMKSYRRMLWHLIEGADKCFCFAILGGGRVTVVQISKAVTHRLIEGMTDEALYQADIQNHPMDDKGKYHIRIGNVSNK